MMKRRELFQTEIKLEFIRRYCLPLKGWRVYVDIDPSEEGRTGGERKTSESRQRQKAMRTAAKKVRTCFKDIGVCCDGGRNKWCKENQLPSILDDRDIVAFHPGRKICLIAEVEGASSGQPEQKLYKAAGQLVCAAGRERDTGWKRVLFLVVNGEKLALYLNKLNMLKKICITGIVINENGEPDQAFPNARTATIG